MNNEQETILLGIVGIKNMGTYNSETTYEKLNVVTYQGSSYCALKETTGNVPTNTEYWQLYAEKGSKGDTGNTGSTGPEGPTGPTGNPGAAPIPVSDSDDMTDTTKIYVLTTDGHWYWYDTDNTQWTDGGVYQATGIDPNDPVIEDINAKFEEIRTKVESVQLFNYNDIVMDKTLQNTFGVSTPDDLTDAEGVFVGNTIYFDEPLAADTEFSTNIIGFSRCLSYINDGTNDVRDGSYNNSSFVNDTVHGNRKITILASPSAKVTAIRFSAAYASQSNIKDCYFCKTSEYVDGLDTEYKNYYELNDKLDVTHLISNNPINYNGNEVNLFYKGIAIGDSLTEGTFNIPGGGFVVHKQYAYPMYFYKKTGVTLRNFGVGGTTAQSWYERYQNVTFPVYDFAIIALGVNDILQSVSNETTITYINNIVNKLKSQNADVKCFIATLNKAYKNQTGWSSLNTAIRTYVNSSVNCYLLDIAEYGKTDVGTPYESGHLTALGYAELANEFANLISYNISKNQEDFKNIQFSGTTYTTLPTD